MLRNVVFILNFFTVLLGTSLKQTGTLVLQRAK